MLEIATTALWVPQGAEYQAVRQGLQGAGLSLSRFYPLPVGPVSVTAALKQWAKETHNPLPAQIVVMGLCGSLTSQLTVGATVVYRGCFDGRVTRQAPYLACDPGLTQCVAQTLGLAVTRVTAVMCDRIICRALDKQTLAQAHNAQVVDMEGYAALDTLLPLGIPISMVRVVSDDCHHDLPDISGAIGANGQIQTLPMARKMLRQPVAAARLIRGSLQGLSQLKQAAAQLFTDSTAGAP